MVLRWYFYALLLDKNQLHEGNMAQSYCSIFYLLQPIHNNKSRSKPKPVCNQPIHNKQNTVYRQNSE